MKLYFFTFILFTLKTCSCKCFDFSEIEFFLPIIPSTIVYFKNIFIPSYKIFVDNPTCLLNIVLENQEQSNTAFLQEIKSQLNETNFKITFLPTIKADISSFDNQQNVMLQGDRFTTRKYIAFVDTDTQFISKVHSFDLFVDGKPRISPLAGVQPGNPYFHRWEKATDILLGKVQPFHSMSFFPVIVLRDHLPLLRQKVMNLHSVTSFESALNKIGARKSEKHAFSQFSLLGAFLWYNHKNEYYWDLMSYIAVEKLFDPNGIHFKRVTEANVTMQDFEFRLPRIARHYKWEGAEKDTIFEKSICLALRKKDKIPSFCSHYRSKTGKQSMWWTFEAVDLIIPEATATRLQDERLEKMKACESEFEWNFKYFPDKFVK